jgi:hypothetical protein
MLTTPLCPSSPENDTGVYYWPTLGGSEHEDRVVMMSRKSRTGQTAEELRERILHHWSVACPLSSLENDSAFREQIGLADSFGFSFRGLLLYAQCGDSYRRQDGLFVRCPEASFGVGLSCRTDCLSAFVVAPQGDEWPAVVAIFARWLIEQGVDRVYVRHLIKGAGSRLPPEVFIKPGQKYGWCDGAEFEDETFNHRFLNLEKRIDIEGGRLRIRDLEASRSADFRKKFRRAHSRFENFLRRYGLDFKLVPFVHADHLSAAQSLVKRHFKYLQEAEKDIGSTALDYERLLHYNLPHGDTYVSMIGFLSRRQDQADGIPVSVFLGERLGPSSGALYCTITLRDPEPILQEFGLSDDVGFTALNQGALARLFGDLLRLGWKSVDLGGSEIRKLDYFKEQLGCELLPSTWCVTTREQLGRLGEFCQREQQRLPGLAMSFTPRRPRPDPAP